MSKVLVIEDDQKIANSVVSGLRTHNIETVWAKTGEDGFFQAALQKFDVIVLDWMLPGRDGIEVIEALREKAIITPILFLTAKDTIEDRVEGLETGADDYLVKPFAFPELVARIRALMRRRGPTASLQISVGDLNMDLLGRKVLRQGRVVDLTNKEFDLLEFLMRHRSQVVSREMIADHVWQSGIGSLTMNNIIDVHMARLRKKIDATGTEKLLHTVRALGFCIKSDDPVGFECHEKF